MPHRLRPVSRTGFRTRAQAPALRDLTVGGLLDEAAQKWPDHEAVIFSAYEDVGIAGPLDLRRAAGAGASGSAGR